MAHPPVDPTPPSAVLPVPAVPSATTNDGTAHRESTHSSQSSASDRHPIIIDYSEKPHSYAPPLPSNTNTTLEKPTLQHIEDNDHSNDHAKEPVDPKSLTWDGPDDPENPKNWPVPLKWYTTLVSGYLCLIVTFGSSVYTTGLADITQDLHVSQPLALSGLTFYLIGLSVGPLFGAPLSELYGRRPVYIVSMPLSMLFIMGSGLSRHFASVAVTRFFAGTFASPAMAVAGGTVSDLWPLEMICFAMTVFSITPFIGTITGPVLGGFVEEVKGWEWTMWLHIILMGSTVPLVLTMRETFAPVILRRRAVKRGIVLKKTDVKASDRIMATLNLTVLQPLKILVFEPTVLWLSIYTAFIFSILFGYFEAYPIIFGELYHMNSGLRGLCFLGIGLGLLMGFFMVIFIDRKLFFPMNPDGTRGQRDADGKVLPPPAEVLLFPCKIAAVLFPIAMFWQAWTANENIHPLAPIAAGVPFGIAILCIFLCVILYFSFSYPPVILASVISANNLLRYFMASIFPLFVPQMYHRLGISWASSLFGFLAVAMAPIPFIFARYGPALRAKSRFHRRIREEAERAALHDHEAEAELEISEVYSSHSRASERV